MSSIRKYVVGQPVPDEETRHREFKEIKGADPVNIIKDAADQYAVAYLNRAPGAVSWGVRDKDHVVVGVQLSPQDCDRLKKDVNAKLQQIKPSVDPAAFGIECHHVYASPTEDELIPDLRVVELTIASRPLDGLYATGGDEVFVKTDSGKKKLSWTEAMSALRDKWQPQSRLTVAFSHKGTPATSLPVMLTSAATPSDHEMRERLAVAATKLPYKPPRPMTRERIVLDMWDPNTFKKATESLATPGGLRGPSAPNPMTTVSNKQFTRWSREYMAYLWRVVAYADEHLRSLPVTFIVRNDGDHAAEVIVLDVAFPEGFLARRRSDLPPRPQEPEQPMPEFQRLTASLQAHSLGPDDTWQRALEDFEVVHGCRGPIFNEHRPNAARYEIDQLVHHDEIALPSVTLTVPKGWRGDTIPVSCCVLSRQQRDPVRITLSLTVTEITTRNPWAVLDASDNARRRA